jgi:hypothetical protein
LIQCYALKCSKYFCNNICLKIAELRADFLGTRAPSAVRIDPVQLMEQAQPQKTNTERIREALDRIRNEKINEPSPALESIRLLRGRNRAPTNGEPEPDPEPDPDPDSENPAA